VAEAPMWEPALTVVDIDVREARRRRHAVPLLAEARLGFLQREISRLLDSGGDG